MEGKTSRLVRSVMRIELLVLLVFAIPVLAHSSQGSASKVKKRSLVKKQKRKDWLLPRRQILAMPSDKRLRYLKGISRAFVQAQGTSRVFSSFQVRPESPLSWLTPNATAQGLNSCQSVVSCVSALTAGHFNKDAKGNLFCDAGAAMDTAFVDSDYSLGACSKPGATACPVELVGYESVDTDSKTVTPRCLPSNGVFYPSSDACFSLFDSASQETLTKVYDDIISEAGIAALNRRMANLCDPNYSGTVDCPVAVYEDRQSGCERFYEVAGSLNQKFGIPRMSIGADQDRGDFCDCLEDAKEAKLPYTKAQQDGALVLKIEQGGGHHDCFQVTGMKVARSTRLIDGKDFSGLGAHLSEKLKNHEPDLKGCGTQGPLKPSDLLGAVESFQCDGMAAAASLRENWNHSTDDGDVRLFSVPGTKAGQAVGDMYVVVRYQEKTGLGRSEQREKVFVLKELADKQIFTQYWGPIRDRPNHPSPESYKNHTGKFPSKAAKYVPTGIEKLHEVDPKCVDSVKSNRFNDWRFRRIEEDEEEQRRNIAPQRDVEVEA